MRERKTIDFRIESALNELDQKLNYVVHAKQYANTACSAVNYYGSRILGIAGVLTVLIGACEKILPVLLPETKAEVYQTSRIKSSSFEEKYSGLAKKVSEKTGVDERILLGLIAGGKTLYADDLRNDYYVGIVPLRPEEAGVTAETLSRDDEQCLLSAARVFKEVAGKQNSPNLEAAVGCFWHRENEATARKIGGRWSYVQSAIEAYERRMHYDYAAHFKEKLQEHEGALAIKKHIEQTFSAKEREFWTQRITALQNEIKNPAFLFHCSAVIEANNRYKAGDEFTWLDLLPPKLAAAVCCAVAYMDGVEFNNGRHN